MANFTSEPYNKHLTDICRSYSFLGSEKTASCAAITTGFKVWMDVLWCYRIKCLYLLYHWLQISFYVTSLGMRAELRVKVRPILSYSDSQSFSIKAGAASLIHVVLTWWVLGCRVDSSVPLMHHDLSDLGSLILIQITPKERTVSNLSDEKHIITEKSWHHPEHRDGGSKCGDATSGDCVTKKLVFNESRYSRYDQSGLQNKNNWTVMIDNTNQIKTGESSRRRLNLGKTKTAGNELNLFVPAYIESNKIRAQF